MNCVVIKKSGSNVVEVGENSDIFTTINYFDGGSETVDLGLRQTDNLFNNIDKVCVKFFAILNRGEANEKVLSFTRESEINKNVYIKYLYNEKKIKLYVNNVSGVALIPDKNGVYLLKDSWDGREDLLFKLTLVVEQGVVDSFSEDIKLDIKYSFCKRG